MARLSDFIDTHCHILPGIDDGPKSLEESAAMARCYASKGIRQIIATPHFIAGTAWSANKERILDVLEKLRAHLDKEHIALRIHTGMEIAYHPKLVDRLEKNLLLPLAASDHYLLEPSFSGTQEGLFHCVKALLQKGHPVIIAHAERITAFQENIDPIMRLVEQGLEIQVNIGSLLDEFDQQCKQTAATLLRERCVHYLASDAHSAIRRRPPTDTEWNILEQMLGNDTLTRLCITNPARLIADHSSLL